MLKKMLILSLVLSLGSFVYAVEDRTGTIVPDFQIAPFSQVATAAAAGTTTDATEGIFQTGGTTDLSQVDAALTYSHEIGTMTISNNNPGGFEITADGANNTGAAYTLFHDGAGISNAGEHVMIYGLKGSDNSESAEASGFGNTYQAGDSASADNSSTLFSVSSPTKATQAGVLKIELDLTGSEILDAFNTEESAEKYTDTITLTLTET